jgi:hypothetical protein
MHLSRRSQRTAWRPQALANCSDCPAGNRGVLTRHLSPSTLPGAGSFGLHPHSRFDPALKQIDLLVRPGSIAWHRAAAQPPQDGVGIFANVVVRPEIKRECHRTLVALAKERPDVGLEAWALGQVHGYCGGMLLLSGLNADERRSAPADLLNRQG